MHNNRLESLNIFISKNIAFSLESVLNRKEYSKIAVLVDENTYQHCYPLLEDFLPEHTLIQIKSGEEQKTLDTCQIIWQALTDNAFDRKSLLINLGGGVIGDMGGFCASTYKRGIEFIQIPTTLLSQVDASVGGKLGIDFNNFKNHIGVFKIPEAVLINVDFLNTLPPAELRSGYAEVIKHCLIADANKWKELRTCEMGNLDWEKIVEHSVAIKAEVVDNDPLEKGLRKILNFGHTIGHAVESYFLDMPDRKLLHGEAIAIGMVAEAFLACEKGFIKIEEVDKIKAYILSVFGHHFIEQEHMGKLIPLTVQDKKNENNLVLASLLEEVGKANFNIELNAEEITRGLEYYNQ